MAPTFTMRSLDLHRKLQSRSKKIVKPIRALYLKVYPEFVFPPLPEEKKSSKASDSSPSSSPSSSRGSSKRTLGDAEIYCSICASRSAGDADSGIRAPCSTPRSLASIDSTSEPSTTVEQHDTAVSEHDGAISTTPSLAITAPLSTRSRMPSTILSLDTLSAQQQSALVHAYATHIEQDYAHIIPWNDRRAHLTHFLEHHWPFEIEDFTRVYFALMGRNLCELRELSRYEDDVREFEQSAAEWGATETKWNRNFRTPKRGVVCFGVHRRQELLFGGWQWPMEKTARAEFAEEVGPMDERLEMVVEPPAGLDWASLAEQQPKVESDAFEDRGPTYWPKWTKEDFHLSSWINIRGTVNQWRWERLYRPLWTPRYNWKAAAARLQEAHPEGGRVRSSKLKGAYKRFAEGNFAVNFAVDRQARAELIAEMERTLWYRLWH